MSDGVAEQHHDTLERVHALERRLDALRTGVVSDGGADGVLPPVGVVSDFISSDASPELRERAARDFLPIPDPQNREGYRPGDDFGYWLTGLEDYEKVLAAAAELSVRGRRLYDFGGSTGRVFRHFYCQAREFDVWSSDFKVGTYLWNQQHLPGDLRVFLNGFAPPLPLPDRHFDIVTAFSVFTHIDELESAWLLELRRILKPGGLLYLSVHDESFWENLPSAALDALHKSPGGEDLNPDSPFPGPRSAFHWTADAHYSCNVFHSRDYIRRQWGRFFEVVDIKPLHAARQSVVTLTYAE